MFDYIIDLFVFWSFEVAVVWIGFYFTQKLDEKSKSRIRLIWLSIIFPFANMLFSLVFHSYEFAYMLFSLLPFLFVLSVFVYFVYKNPFYLKSITLSIIFSLVLGFFYLILIEFPEIERFNKNIENEKMSALKEYSSVIDCLENYKIMHKIYPKNLTFCRVNAKKYPYHRYETREDERNYILTVSAYENFDINPYHYCSSSKYDGCHPKEGYPIKYIQHGKWIEAINQD